MRPAFDHNFCLSEKLDCVVTLTVEIAKKAIFPAAKWKVRYRCSDTNVNANIACLGFVAELTSGSSTISVGPALSRCLFPFFCLSQQFSSRDMGLLLKKVAFLLDLLGTSRMTAKST